MNKSASRQLNPDSPLYKAISDITSIIEKYTDQMELLDIIDIVDNLRVLAEIAEGSKIESKIA
ncbi:MAG: hypothetical protein VR68_07130 [Peptococcaceae bacterium BRH_c4a]|nr:MAG: hypothetical protein VR68_07130 [Peptococcaceae bacterium BRH_c4a]